MSPEESEMQTLRGAIDRFLRRRVLDRPRYDTRAYAHLSAEETAAFIHHLHDEQGLTFGDIAMCTRRDRRWVEERYEAFDGGDADA